MGIRCRLIASTFASTFAASLAAQSFAVVPAATVAHNYSTLSDVNRDGVPDLVTDAGVWLGDGTGRFLTSTFTPPTPPNGTPAVGDFDGDGHADIAYYGATTLTVYGGDSTGAFSLRQSSPNPTFTLAANPWINRSDAVDVDRDGHLDLVSGSGHRPILISQTDFNSEISIYYGDGAGGLGQRMSMDRRFSIAPHMRVVDIDGDGLPDLVTAGAGGTLTVSRNLGGRTFAPRVSYIAATRGAARGLQIADVNGDGLLDAVCYFTMVIVNTRAVETFLQRPDGGFSTSISSSLPAAQRVVDPGFVLADFDGDGDEDVLLGRDFEPTELLLGDGTGRFVAAASLISEQGSPIAGDFDSDGDVDFAMNGGSAFLNQRAHPAGVASFGTGRAGCEGMIGATATSSPFIGNADLAFVATNAPARARIGVCYIANASNVAGLDVLDFRFHVDPIASAFLVTIPIALEPTTSVRAPLAIPASAAGLVGTTLYAQCKFWLPTPGPCRASLLQVTTGPGIAFTLQP